MRQKRRWWRGSDLGLQQLQLAVLIHQDPVGVGGQEAHRPPAGHGEGGARRERVVTGLALATLRLTGGGGRLHRRSAVGLVRGGAEAVGGGVAHGAAGPADGTLPGGRLAARVRVGGRAAALAVGEAFGRGAAHPVGRGWGAGHALPGAGQADGGVAVLVGAAAVGRAPGVRGGGAVDGFQVVRVHGRRVGAAGAVPGAPVAGRRGVGGAGGRLRGAGTAWGHAPVGGASREGRLPVLVQRAVGGRAHSGGGGGRR